MTCADTPPEAISLLAALAEELAFAVTPDLMAEQYRTPSSALDRLAAAKAFLEQHHHPVGPNVREVVEIAIAQGILSE